MKVVRRPETHYFDHGSIKFQISKGELFYRVKVWDLEGYQSITNQWLRVIDQKHLDDLQEVQTAEQLRRTVTQESLN